MASTERGLAKQGQLSTAHLDRNLAEARNALHRCWGFLLSTLVCEWLMYVCVCERVCGLEGG